MGNKFFEVSPEVQREIDILKEAQLSFEFGEAQEKFRHAYWELKKTRENLVNFISQKTGYSRESVEPYVGGVKDVLEQVGYEEAIKKVMNEEEGAE